MKFGMWVYLGNISNLLIHYYIYFMVKKTQNIQKIQLQKNNGEN